MQLAGKKVDGLTHHLDQKIADIHQNLDAAVAVVRADIQAHRDDITAGQDRKFAAVARDLQMIREALTATSTPEFATSQGEAVYQESQPDPTIAPASRLAEQVAELQQHVAALNTQVEQLRAGTPAAAPQPAALDGVRELSELKKDAARVSSVSLVAHRDTWAFVVQQAAAHRFFRVPGQVEDVDGHRVEVQLSGPSLLAVVSSLHHTVTSDESGFDSDMRAIAESVYRRIAEAMTGLKPSVQVESGGGPWMRRPRIVIDDQVDEPEK